MKRRKRAALVLFVLSLVAAACGNSKGSGGGGAAAGAERTGVTDTEIRVGGVASTTNGLGGVYGDAFDGVQAYFDQVNAQGGVFGRQLKLVAKRDDNGQASRNKDQVRALVEQDKVFAVLPVSTITFSGAKYLADNKIPTFGWNINPEWNLGPNLFGEKGSNLCFDCPNAWSSYLAKQNGFTNFGILTYTAVQSQDCAKGWEALGAADRWSEGRHQAGVRGQEPQLRFLAGRPGRRPRPDEEERRSLPRDVHRRCRQRAARSGAQGQQDGRRAEPAERLRQQASSATTRPRWKATTSR